MEKFDESLSQRATMPRWNVHARHALQRKKKRVKQKNERNEKEKEKNERREVKRSRRIKIIV